MRIRAASTDWTALLIWMAIVVAGFGGWIANIVKLVSHSADASIGMLVARGVGIVVAPLGAVLGFF